MDRQAVSGWWTWGVDWACVNQVWNWIRGEGESWERERVPLVYWSARYVVGLADVDGDVGLGFVGETWGGIV